jgi:hypothetical protein
MRELSVMISRRIIMQHNEELGRFGPLSHRRTTAGTQEVGYAGAVAEDVRSDRGSRAYGLQGGNYGVSCSPGPEAAFLLHGRVSGIIRIINDEDSD